ncbi:hypothetical protein AXF42_Ash010513 [Apostasia shenzhenica]|uniref:Bromo domain-containing protein n=1 Tax=Apostasia shenzhenica TaxID=1088818 RepID=A0A2I0A6A7_9ASPA|nr:hypothetical protein AXF42_Ash010513 [Apostasia shenzhenica]
MASTERSGDPANEIWGTWEELLLACAVNRHGTRSWDSVAMEIQARSPFSDLFTPQSCRQRYIDLRRRFESNGSGIKNDADDDSCGGDSGSPAEIPWLEELRKLRMAELRREVERYDASITSLQSKLKQLRAERETSEREMDLKEEEKDKDGELPDSPPGLIVRGDRMSCGDSRGSCKESNSTDLKVKDHKNSAGGEEADGAKTAQEADTRPAPTARPAGEVSYNGSSETLQKGAAQTAEERPPTGESGESVAGESAEVLGGKESSDVQSSASLSRRRRGRRRKAVSGSSSIAGDAETDAVSPIAACTRRTAAGSQPLASSLEIIRSSKYGSIFLRRLDSQESTNYRNLIRRHVDLEIVRARLERKGGAKYTSAEFFRDLLLLCNNAIVFFPKGSPESAAAVHLRDIVFKEMSTILPKRVPRPPLPPAMKESSSPPSKSVTMLKLDADLKSSLPGRKRSSGSIVACRKRSSIAAKVAAVGVSEAAGKEETEGIPDSDPKVEEDDKPIIAKSKMKERSKVPATRGFRTSKTRGSSGNRNSRNSKPSSKSSFVAEENAEEVPLKSQKKVVTAPSTSASKKRNVAGFLNRLKEKSSPSPTEGKLLGSLKIPRGGSGGREAEQKRGTKEGRKEAASSNQEKVTSADSSPPAKRSVGRPPKRLAPTPSPPPAKRAKEETAPSKRPPAPPRRKRGRK